MSKTVGIVGVISCTLIFAISALAYALFHGYLDQGEFRVLSAQKSPSGQLAMVAKRSDHKAMNGDEVFVLVGDRIFSPAELKHALHSPAVIFSADRECLHLEWKGSDDLVISCVGDVMARSEINRQLYKRNNLAFTYVNIANAQ